MRHAGAALRQIGAEPEEHVVRDHRPGRRLINHLMQSIAGDVLGDYLEIGDDHTEKPVIGQDPVDLRDRLADLEKIQVFNTMRYPDRVRRAAFDRRKIGHVGKNIGCHSCVDVDSHLAPVGEHRGQPRSPLLAGAQIDQHFGTLVLLMRGGVAHGAKRVLRASPQEMIGAADAATSEFIGLSAVGKAGPGGARVSSQDEVAPLG